MDKHLHIITHEVPWPANYGGVFDLFYKIKSLHQSGVKIHLHCFNNKKVEQPFLDKYCETVHYYERKNNFSFYYLNVPFIVQSRRDSRLLINLKKDNFPILMEGIHCTFFHQQLFRKRKIFVRLHNAESRYYYHLAVHETNTPKKLYYKIESLLLSRYEKKLAKTGNYLAVSKSDIDFYKQYPCSENIIFLPVFIPWSTIKSSTIQGNYCLYHGNLSVIENEKAAIWLLKEVFGKINIPFVIAGNNPSKELIKLAHSFTHTCIVVNPSEHEMEDLIRKAQVNILPSFNYTGVKMKIIHALTNGKHCLVNQNAVDGNELSEYCHIANSAEEFRNETKRLFSTEFSESEIKERNKLTEDLFNNAKTAALLIEQLY